MSTDPSSKLIVLPLPDAERVDRACDRFEATWRAGDWPCIEGYLDAVPEPCRAILLRELIELEVELRLEVGERPTAAEYVLRFPAQAAEIDAIFQQGRRSGTLRPTFPGKMHRPDIPSGDAVTAEGSTLDWRTGQVGDLPEMDGAFGRIIGDHLILDRLGSGGMGVVYRALQRSAGRIVALKVIKADWLGDSTFASHHQSELRFRNGVQAQAQLEHDHIVPVYEVGHAEGILFFSMRLIKGRTLSHVVRSGGPLPPRRAAYYIEAVARAIQYAHDHQIIHRDLKPGNIMVDEHDRPFVIDLGLAKSLEATEYTTHSGKAMGTAEFMSPEQALGRQDAGFSSDVYGLGATLFALLTGRPPFTGPNPTVVLRKVIDEEPAWPAEMDQPVGREMKAICLMCLEKDPGRRFRSAGALAVALNKYLNYESTGVVLPGPWTRCVRWVRRQPWRAAAAGVALIAAIVAASAAAWTFGHHRATAEILIHNIQVAPFSRLDETIRQMAGYRFWVDRRLHELLATGPADPELRTRLALALLPTEPSRAKELADRLLACDHEQHRVIREALRVHWSRVAPRLRAVLDDTSSSSSRRARAATALIALESPERHEDRAWSDLRMVEVPDPRTELLDFLVRSRVEPRVVADRLAWEGDPSVRRQLFQALASSCEGRPPEGVPKEFLDALPTIFRSDPDPGIHSSAAYLMRRCGLGPVVTRIDTELAGKPRAGRRWYVNPRGMTMVVLDVPEEYRPSPPEPGQPVARFAIATTETPLEIFQEFLSAHAERRKKRGLFSATGGDAPADYLSYFEAARFCNWLSEREGIPPDQWCYLRGKHEGVWVMAPDYTTRRGYRLPSVQEWEYAARAGTITDRYFGQELIHLDDYAWNRKNAELRPHSIGMLRPNDFGLFDVLGNVYEWCYNPNNSCQLDCKCWKEKETGPDPEEAGPCELRPQSLRGGSFYNQPPIFTAKKYDDFYETSPPMDLVSEGGFRVVKNEP